MLPDPLPDPRQLLRCSACGQTDELSPATLLRHMRSGWPECCGRPMVFYRAADRPVEPGTRYTHKCPTCGSEWAITFPPGVDVPSDPAAVCGRCRAVPPAPA